MSNNRTGYLTPPLERRHSTGRHDVDTQANSDNVSLPPGHKRRAHSESSVTKVKPGGAVSGYGKHVHQSTKDKRTLDNAKAKNEISQIAFDVHGNAPSDLDVSHAGSWCKRE